MPRPSNAPVRRAQITTAATFVFAQAGFRGATTNAIAKQAALSAGLLHYHFKSKAEIGAATVHALAAALQQRVPPLPAEPAGDRGHTPDCAPLDAWIDALLGLGDDADSTVLAAWVVLSAAALSEPVIREARAAVVAALAEDLTARCARALAADASDQAALASGVSATLLALVDGLFHTAVHTPGLLREGAAAAQAKTAARAWLAVPAGLAAAAGEVTP